MAKQMDKHCDTCRFAKNPHTTKSTVVEVKCLTCWYNLPHECQPCNTCNFWEPKEAGR